MSNKIAIFGHKHIFTESGGVEVVVTELAKRLAKNNEVTVIDRYELDKPRHKTKTIPHLKVKKAPTFSNPKVNAAMSSFMSTMYCLFGKYDVVFVHAEGQCGFLPFLKKKGTPIVAMVHGLDWQRAKWGNFASKYIKFCEKQMVKYADEIIVLSDDMKKYFKDNYNRETFKIENGVSAKPDENTDEIEKLGLAKGEYILYIGRIVPEKRLDLLITAYLLANTGKKLVIAGEIPEGSDIAEMVKGTDIITPGFVGGKLKNQLITNCSLFVLPSDLEGQSIALLEAMAYGAPVLVSDIPENKDTVKDFGMMFKAGDLESLTDKLDESVNKKFDIEAQKKYIHQHHDWDVVVQRVEGILRRGIIKCRCRKK